MAFKATEAQKLAIETDGNVLVSAAAGSGKTAVLVERVMRLLCDEKNPVSADRMLIVTFTNAAAAEMKARIEKRIDAELKNNSSKNLLRQKFLLSNAKICTIDSFCIDLVRENFEKLGINPDFKMSDNGTISEIDNRVISSIVNEYISSGNEDFLTLLDIIGAEYDEKNFCKAVLDIYNFSRQLAEPTEWFESIKTPFLSTGFDECNEWFNFAFDLAEEKIFDLRNSVATIIDKISDNEKAANKFLPNLIFVSGMLSDLAEISNKRDWDILHKSLCEFVLPSKPDARGFSGVTAVSVIKLFYEEVQNTIDTLNKYFFATKNDIEEQIDFLRKPVIILSDILKRFEHELFEEYLSENIFTFHNTEHLALKLLTDVDENGENEFLNRYDVVMVDEYQDTNNLQDRLFSVLSCNEKKLFAVGDIKQSIYGFRGANPENFSKKKERYIDVQLAKGDEPKKIILSNNFRSNPEICSFINYFFSLFMTKNNVGLNYGEEEKLIPLPREEKSDDAVELRLIEKQNSSESELVLEALAILDYIKKICNSGECIKSKNGFRKAEFSDFAILMRATRYKADKIATVLRGAGIPVNFSVEGFAQRTEIQTILSFLKIIDNPKNDIELACVMLSPIFCFTPDELAQIRMSKRNGDFYSAVQFSAKAGNKKAAEFIKTLDNYRKRSVIMSVAKTLSLVVNESGFINIVSAMNEGTTRRNNLFLLIEYANEYEASNGSNLSKFIDYIKNQSESGLKSALAGTGSNAVKIMSIHASKGLQFPICIIANTSSAFKKDYNKNPVCYTQEQGVGFKFLDEKKGKKTTTLNYEIMGEIEKKQVRAEELRLLYVAMTRAEEKLLFITTVNSIEKQNADLTQKLFLSDNKVNMQLFSKLNSYSEWLLIAAALHKKGTILREKGEIIPNESEASLNITIFEETDEETIYENINEDFVVDDTVCEKIAQNISFSYPYERIRQIEAKTSVSAVANKAESNKYIFKDMPSFMSGQGMSATQKGTTMHKIIQFFDFENYKDIHAEIERLKEWKFISELEAENANISALKNFFESEIFRRIISAESLHREMRFLTQIDPKVIDNTIEKSGEKVILQGAVDLCFVEEDGIVILDFKTDRVNEEQELINSYSEQLEYYALACGKIFNLPVKEKIIYSFALSKAISL